MTTPGGEGEGEIDGDGAGGVDPGQLDRAVADLAARFRAALEPPARAGVAIDAESLRRRLEEPLPEQGIDLDRLLPELAD
jgi:hypothetical protein